MPTQPAVIPTAFAAVFLAAAAFAQSSYVNFEGPQTNPIRLSADGTRLYAANTADNRLSVFDLGNPSSPVRIAEIPVGLEPVSVNPRTNDEVWVANHVSDSVSVVSVSLGIVIDTIQVKDEPCDVVFAGTPLRAFVTAARSNQVRVFDLATHAQVASIALQGQNPRALAVSPDGTKVYAAFALSGNRTTIVPRSVAPPQPPPTNPLLPPPPPVALIVDATDPVWSPSVIDYTVLDHDVAEIDANALTLTRYFDRAGTVDFGLAVKPGGAELWVANTDARNLVRFETALRGHTVDNRVTRITLGATPTVTPIDLNPGLDYGLLPNPAALATALSQPTAVVFDPAGTFAYVASFGTDRVGKLDASGNVVARIQIGPVSSSAPDSRHARGPRGLAMHPSGSHLYVENRFSNTISVVQISGAVEIAEIDVGSFDPTPPAIRAGRGFLYDGKLSGNGTNSCASCHIDNDTDTLAWDLGNPGGNMATVTDPQSGAQLQMHPMKGPMTTQILRGLANMAPFHWRGDKPGLADFNAAFDGLMGSSQIPAADMQAFSDFMSATPYEPNPNQNLDRTLPPVLFGFNPTFGQTQFTQTPSPVGGPACGSCHSSPLQLAPRVAQNPPVGAIVAKVPTFRDFYRRWRIFSTAPGAQNITGYGFEHDGQLDELAIPQLNNIRAFIACFDSNTAPAVGATRTVTASNASNATLVGDVTTLRARAAAGDCDLVGKGRIDGVVMGLLYRVATSDFQSDTSGFGPYTWADLQARALAGAVFSLLGVPPGSGERIGVDRDLDGVLDGNEPAAGPVGTPFCFGDGTLATACPCANTGLAGRGCENSAGTGGSRLEAFGSTSPDTVVLTATNELPTALTIFLQGDVEDGAGLVFGDGVRCAAGSLKRIGTRNAAGGTVYYPHAGELSISARSAALGDPIASGQTRAYQAYYRDPGAVFCPAPAGATFNVGNAVRITW